MSYVPANFVAARRLVSLVMSDTSLDMSTRGLMALYADIADLNAPVPCVFAKASTMMERTGWSAPTYRKHRDRLVEAGYLIREDGDDGRVYLWFNMEKIFREQGEKNFPPSLKEEKTKETQQTGPCAPPDEGGTAVPPKPKPAPLPKPLPAETLAAIERQIAQGTANGSILNPGGYRRTLLRLAHEGRYEPPPTPQTSRMEPYRPPWMDDDEPTARNSPEVRAAIGELCREFLGGGTAWS